MSEALTALQQALQPKKPYYTVNYEAGDPTAEIVVYNPYTDEEEYRAAVTLQVALTMLPDASRTWVDFGDRAGFGDIDAITNALEQGTAYTPQAPTPVTCSIGDIVHSIYAESKLSGSDMVTVTVGPATWMVKL